MRRAKRPPRTETRGEQELPDAPLPEDYDPEDLTGESEYSADQAGERMLYERRRAPGGPPDRDPFTVTPDSDIGRRALEDATQAPAQELYEPQPEFEGEDVELESSSGPDEDFAEEELGPVEDEEEPDDEELLRQERGAGSRPDRR